MEIGYTLTSSTKQQGERWTMDYNLTRISFDRGKNESRGSNLLSCTGRRPNTALSLSLSLSHSDIPLFTHRPYFLRRS